MGFFKISKGPALNGETLSQKQVKCDSFSNSSLEREQLLLVDKLLREHVTPQIIPQWFYDMFRV